VNYPDAGGAGRVGGALPFLPDGGEEVLLRVPQGAFLVEDFIPSVAIDTNGRGRDQNGGGLARLSQAFAQEPGADEPAAADSCLTASRPPPPYVLTGQVHDRVEPLQIVRIELAPVRIPADLSVSGRAPYDWTNAVSLGGEMPDQRGTDETARTSHGYVKSRAIRGGIGHRSGGEK
jgi:hypothetical protein